jgi:hypothetical protein
MREAGGIDPASSNLEVALETFAAVLRGAARWLISLGMAGAIVLYALSIVLSARREIPRIVKQQGTETLKQLQIPE